MASVRVAVLAAIGLAVPPGFAGRTLAAPPGCDLQVTVSASPTPGGARKAQVTIPQGPAGVRFRASSGTTGPSLRASADSLVAEFTPGPQPPPLALVAAVGGNLCGFAVVRLGGERPGQPGAPVTMAVVTPPVVRGDREAKVQVYVFAVDEKGVPRRGNAPTIRPGVGAVAGLEAVAPGAWRGRWTIPAIEAASVSVEAGFGREPVALASVDRTPGPAAAIEIIKDSGSPGASDTPNALLVRVRDAAGNLTDAQLEVEADAVKLGKTVRLEVGLYRVPLLVPPGSPDQEFVVDVRTEGATGQARFSSAYSAAAEVRVTPLGPIHADASARGQFEVLEVAVLDANGNPVNDRPVGSGGGGTFREAFRVGPGRWALPYRPPAISEDGSEQVVVTAGGASTTVDLSLVAKRIALSVGLKAGLAVASGGTGLSVGAEGGAWTPIRRSRLGLLLDLDWWMLSKSSTATVGSTAASYEATQHYPSLLLSAAWRTPFAGRWTFGATLGGGLAMVMNRAQLAGQASVSERGTAPVVSGSISASPRLGTGALFFEARTTWIGNAGLSTLSGSSTTFLGLVGYRFDVG